MVQRVGVESELNVSEVDKVKIYGAVFPTILEALQSCSDVELTADDIVDFFGLCVASIHDNDSYVVTPRDRRLAVQSSATYVERWMKALRDIRPGAQPSLLERVLGGAGAPENQPHAVN